MQEPQAMYRIPFLHFHYRQELFSVSDIGHFVRSASQFTAAGQLLLICFQRLFRKDIQKFQFLPIQTCLSQNPRPVIYQFQGEERPVFLQKPEEQLIAGPEIQAKYRLLVHPFQRSFVAGKHIPGKTRRGIERHIFQAFLSGHKGHQTPEPVVRQRKPCFFPHFPKQTLLRTLRPLKMPADADPFVLVDVMLLLHPVKHEIFIILFDVTKCR